MNGVWLNILPPNIFGTIRTYYELLIDDALTSIDKLSVQAVHMILLKCV